MKEIDVIYMLHDFTEFLIERNLKANYDSLTDYLLNNWDNEIKLYQLENSTSFSYDELHRKLEQFLLILKS